MSKEIRRPKPDKKRLRRTLLMAALESPLGIMNAYEIVTASPRMFGCAISGGDFRKSMHVRIQRDGVEMMVARGQMLLAARAAGVQCFDTMYPNIDDMEGFKAEVIQNHKMGFDGKSIVNPKQIAFVHETFAPTEKEIAYAEKLVRGCQAQAVAATFLLTATFGTPVSPSVAAVYVGLGLADITIGDHIKYSLKFVWPMSILTLIASTLLGVIPF